MVCRYCEFNGILFIISSMLIQRSVEHIILSKTPKHRNQLAIHQRPRLRNGLSPSSGQRTWPFLKTCPVLTRATQGSICPHLSPAQAAHFMQAAFTARDSASQIVLGAIICPRARPALGVLEMNIPRKPRNQGIDSARDSPRMDCPRPSNLVLWLPCSNRPTISHKSLGVHTGRAESTYFHFPLAIAFDSEA